MQSLVIPRTRNGSVSPWNLRREGGQSLVIGGSSLVILEGEGGQSLVIGGSSLVILEGKGGRSLVTGGSSLVMFRREGRAIPLRQMPLAGSY